MNYISQIKAYYANVGVGRYLKPTSFMVYDCLLEICNQSGWKDPFTATYTQVLNMTGISNHKTYYSALKQLVELGYIDWEKSPNQHLAASFSIKVLYQNSEEHVQSTVHARTKHGASTVHIHKQLNNKQVNTDDEFSFDVFWSLYDKKTGDKTKLEKKWDALKIEERKLAIETIPKYKDSTPDKKFRKNPETYLNKEGWKDEILDENTQPEKSGFVLGKKPINYVNHGK